MLDTCTIIFGANGTAMNVTAVKAIDTAIDSGDIRISPVSAWELGLLMSRNRIASTSEPLDFFNETLIRTLAKVCELTPEILVNSCYLPGVIHRDPMDRILIATARAHDLTIVTSDRAILDYGAAGHVKTLEC
ncbi:MAG: type II toxin-antitoxin system VapC family toxin [Rhizobiaceae bacterium]